MLATTRAIVVLPVPGGPAKIMCLDVWATFMPRAARTLAICVAARYASICSLTLRQPDLAVQFGLRVGEQLLATRGVGHHAGRIPRVAPRRDLLRRGGHQPVCRILQRGRDFRLRMGGLQPLQQRHGGLFVALAATRHRQVPGDGGRARLPRRRRIRFGQSAFGLGEQPEVGRRHAVRDAGRGGQELVRPAAGAPDFVDDVGPAFGGAVDHRLDPGHQCSAPVDGTSSSASIASA